MHNQLEWPHHDKHESRSQLSTAYNKEQDGKNEQHHHYHFEVLGAILQRHGQIIFGHLGRDYGLEGPGVIG